MLQGKIGEYLVTAQRKGTDWFIGVVSSGPTRTFQIPLEFLPEDKAYEAHLYCHDPQMPTETHVRIDTKQVQRTTVFDLHVEANGGLAIHLRPVL